MGGLTDNNAENVIGKTLLLSSHNTLCYRAQRTCEIYKGDAEMYVFVYVYSFNFMHLHGLFLSIFLT